MRERLCISGLIRQSITFLGFFYRSETPEVQEDKVMLPLNDERPFFITSRKILYYFLCFLCCSQDSHTQGNARDAKGSTILSRLVTKISTFCLLGVVSNIK